MVGDCGGLDTIELLRPARPNALRHASVCRTVVATPLLRVNDVGGYFGQRAQRCRNLERSAICTMLRGLVYKYNAIICTG